MFDSNLINYILYNYRFSLKENLNKFFLNKKHEFKPIKLVIDYWGLYLIYRCKNCSFDFSFGLNVNTGYYEYYIYYMGRYYKFNCNEISIIKIIK